MRYISSRSKNTPPSPIRSLSAHAESAKQRGLELIHLNIGQPDLPCPDEFITGLQNSITHHIEYAPSAGLKSLRESWAAWIDREYNTHTDPNNYIITSGASEGLVFVFTACADPGDEIITFDPTYANYLGFAAQTGVRLVAIEGSIADNFELPSDIIIKKHITSRTRAILLCNPNNPTGVLYSQDAIKRLLRLCQERGLYLILDETYREIVYDGRPACTALDFAKNNNHIIVIDSISKRFSLCGARIGAMYVPYRSLREKILQISQARLSAPILEQMATTHLLQNMPQDYLQKIKDTYQSRRNCLIDNLKTIPGVQYTNPQASFYTLVKLPVQDATEFAKWLLEHYSVDGKTLFVAPACGFYSISGKGVDEIRLAFVLNEQDLTLATKILKSGLDVFKA